MIRRADRNGTVTTVAGRDGEQAHVDGDAASARFTELCSLAFGPDGALYASE